MATTVEQKLSGGGLPAKRANVLLNSFWYGLEMTLDVVVTALLSIVVARVIGPERLGQFVYFVFLTNIANRFAGLGTGVAARKYLSEHLARGEMGRARCVFFTTLRLQIALAVAVPALGIALVFLFVDPAFRLTACILVAAIFPGLLVSVPSSTNMAAENFSRNVPGALAGLVAYAVIVVLTLTMGWGLAGLAAAMFLRRMLECTVRMIPALRWMYSLPKEHAPKDLYRKLMTFSGQALAITAVLLIVNDRSEIFFLKHFCDVRQVAFYSIAFSLAEYLLTIPTVFGSAITSAFMAEHARDPERAGQRTSMSLTYLVLLIAPMHLGLAVISQPLVKIAYGSAYIPAISALVIAATLALGKAFFWLPFAIYQASDRQQIMLRKLLIASAVNLALDAALIPWLGATGAAIGNGASQAFAVGLLWSRAASLGRVRLDWRRIVRILGAAMAMALTVTAATSLLPAREGLIIGVVVGVISYLVYLRLFSVLYPEDVETLTAGTSLPKVVRACLARVLPMVVVPGPAGQSLGTTP